MKIQIVNYEGTPEELDRSRVLQELLGQDDSTTDVDSTETVPVPVEDVEADDAAADLAAAEEATATAASTSTASEVPGVAQEGQETVRGLLAKNPAGHLFERFLAETTTWPNAKVFGVKPKSHLPGTPLDYHRYLRLRKWGSSFGGFAYVYAVDGTVNLRLAYDTDEELNAIAPNACRLHAGHREYRVNIKITDEETLKQAIELARRAYDLT
jgi:hypothetical protein